MIKKLIVASFLICLCASLIFAEDAAKIKDLSYSHLQSILKDKTFSGGDIKHFAETGNLFIVARDVKTKKLSWRVYNPYSGKILKEGACPFVEYTAVNINSPGTKALVFGRYPTAVWALDIESGKWEQGYKNPVKSGLAIIPISYPSAMGNSFRSIFDLWNDDHAVKDTFIVAINPEPFKIERIASLPNLKKEALKLIKIGEGESFVSGMSTASSTGDLLFVLENGQVREKRREILFLRKNSGEISVIEDVKGKKILPLDIEESSILYAVGGGKDQKATDVFMSTYAMDKTLVFNKGNALAGSILKDGNFMIYSSETAGNYVYFGKAGNMQRILRSTDPDAKIGILPDAGKFYMICKDKYSYYAIPTTTSSKETGSK